jgi:ubiquinone/menaquinone biosynthesis C-methylase UbiE
VQADASAEAARIRSVYEGGYSSASSTAWTSRWNARNLTAVYFRQRVERELVAALNATGIELRGAEVLDVGCGGAPHLRFLAELGADRSRLHGVDLVPERIEIARERSPGFDLVVADATELPFADDSFDLVTQFTALCNIVDERVLELAVTEMKRVLRPAGALVWFDIARASAGAAYRPIPAQRLRTLFADFAIAYERPLFHRWTEPLAGRSPELCGLLERLPLPKSNLLAVLRRR